MKETNNNYECNIVGPHSHLVAGQTFPCEKEGKPVSNKLPNKEEEMEFNREIRRSESELIVERNKPLSPSDKTWEEQEQEELCSKVCYLLAKFYDEDRDLFETWKEIKHHVAVELTSATIKAKEEVLRGMLSYAVSNVENTSFNLMWINAHIKEYAKSLGINLEEPR